MVYIKTMGYDIAKNLIDSMDSNGVIIDPKKFDLAIKHLNNEYHSDETFEAITDLIENGLDEDFANDIVFKYLG